MGAITGANSLDFMKGVLAQIDFSAWVTAGGSGTFTYTGGWIEDLSIEESREWAKVEPDNCTYPVDAYPTKSSIIIKGNFVEASLRKKVLAIGGAAADVVVASGSATLPLKELSTLTYFQTKITVAGQSMKPGHTEFPNDVYVKRTWLFWRCLFRSKVSRTLKGVTKTPFELEVFYDTTVTETSTKGALGTEVDSTT